MKPRLSKTFLRRALLGLAAFAALASLTLLACNHRVASAADGNLFSRAADVPALPVAVVLGCSPRLSDGRENLFFTFRMDAAAELFHAGKSQILLVSGDNRFQNYDEPGEMKKALTARGVPADRIVCDYAGRRTLDSVIRAWKIFGQEKFIIVSQPFHNTRALYIAKSNGLDAVGFNARDIRAPAALRVYLRECLARTKAVLDVEVLHLQPQVMGSPETLPAP